MLLKKFEEMNIGYLFYIGGNDSMDTVSKLSRYAEMVGSDICFLGIPKTIDNDLVNTDHTPGFGSAARYILPAKIPTIAEAFSRARPMPPSYTVAAINRISKGRMP